MVSWGSSGSGWWWSSSLFHLLHSWAQMRVAEAIQSKLFSWWIFEMSESITHPLQAHLKSLLASYLLTFHWLKEDTWSSSASVSWRSMLYPQWSREVNSLWIISALISSLKKLKWGSLFISELCYLLLFFKMQLIWKVLSTGKPRNLEVTSLISKVLVVELVPYNGETVR